MSPQRVQRKRTAGWRMPENTVYVGRPGKWRNPFKIGAQGFLFENGGAIFYRGSGATAANVTQLYRDEVAPKLGDAARAELAGKNLACWCPPGQPCHADVLLKLANTEDWMTAGNEVVYWAGVRAEHYAPRNGTIIESGVVIFGGTACVRIRKQDGGTDYIQLSHIEPAA